MVSNLINCQIIWIPIPLPHFFWIAITSKQPIKCRKSFTTLYPIFQQPQCCRQLSWHFFSLGTLSIPSSKHIGIQPFALDLFVNPNHPIFCSILIDRMWHSSLDPSRTRLLPRQTHCVFKVKFMMHFLIMFKSLKKKEQFRIFSNTHKNSGTKQNEIITSTSVIKSSIQIR